MLSTCFNCCAPLMVAQGSMAVPEPTASQQHSRTAGRQHWVAGPGHNLPFPELTVLPTWPAHELVGHARSGGSYCGAWWRPSNLEASSGKRGCEPEILRLCVKESFPKDANGAGAIPHHGGRLCA